MTCEFRKPMRPRNSQCGLTPHFGTASVGFVKDTGGPPAPKNIKTKEGQEEWLGEIVKRIAMSGFPPGDVDKLIGVRLKSRTALARHAGRREPVLTSLYTSARRDHDTLHRLVDDPTPCKPLKGCTAGRLDIAQPFADALRVSAESCRTLALLIMHERRRKRTLLELVTSYGKLVRLLRDRMKLSHHAIGFLFEWKKKGALPVDVDVIGDARERVRRAYHSSRPFPKVVVRRATRAPAE